VLGAKHMTVRAETSEVWCVKGGEEKNFEVGEIVEIRVVNRGGHNITRTKKSEGPNRCPRKSIKLRQNS